MKKAETRLFWNLDEAEYTGVAVVGLGKRGAQFNELEELHEGKENVREAAAGKIANINILTLLFLQVRIIIVQPEK